MRGRYNKSIEKTSLMRAIEYFIFSIKKKENYEIRLILRVLYYFRNYYKKYSTSYLKYACYIHILEQNMYFH